MNGKRRLFWQVYPSYLLITVIALAAATWYASGAFRTFYLDRTASDLKARARLFEMEVLPSLDPLDEKKVDRLTKAIGSHASTRITVILPSGKVIGDSDEDPASMDTHVDRSEFLQAMKGDFGSSIRHSLTLHEDLMYAAIPVVKGGRTLAVVRTAIPISAIDAAYQSIRTKVILAGLVIAAFAALLGLLVSRKITRPIQQIRDWAESLARGEYQLRPSVRGSREMEALSASLGQTAQELRERMETVVRQRNEMEAVFSSMAEGVVALSMEERVIHMNQVAADILCCNRAEANGRTIQEVARNTVLHRFLRDTLSSREPMEADVLMSPDEAFVVNAHGTMLLDSSGNRIGALIVLNDVTRLRKLENIRSDFVANVSHEIKTPITAIKGFVETLRDGAANDPQEAKRFLTIIAKHVDRLEAIVEDLLRLSRIEREAEKGGLTLIESRIVDILKTAVQVCQGRAEVKEIRMDIVCPESITLKADSPLLEQAVVNLLDNAIKYSEERSAIQVETTTSDDEIVISVCDHGCGIEKKHLPRLFERFYRVDKARSRQVGGTGLGLAIVKHIVRAHGGHLSVESVSGKGSRFSIHLPRT